MYIQVDPEKPVLVAGDPERAHETRVKKDGGIWYHDAVILAVVSDSIATSPIKHTTLTGGHIFLKPQSPQHAPLILTGTKPKSPHILQLVP